MLDLLRFPTGVKDVQRAIVYSCKRSGWLWVRFPREGWAKYYALVHTGIPKGASDSSSTHTKTDDLSDGGHMTLWLAENEPDISQQQRIYLNKCAMSYRGQCTMEDGSTAFYLTLNNIEAVQEELNKRHQQQTQNSGNSSSNKQPLAALSSPGGFKNGLLSTRSRKTVGKTDTAIVIHLYFKEESEFFSWITHLGNSIKRSSAAMRTDTMDDSQLDFIMHGHATMRIDKVLLSANNNDENLPANDDSVPPVAPVGVRFRPVWLGLRAGCLCSFDKPPFVGLRAIVNLRGTGVHAEEQNQFDSPSKVRTHSFRLLTADRQRILCAGLSAENTSSWLDSLSRSWGQFTAGDEAARAHLAHKTKQFTFRSDNARHQTIAALTKQATVPPTPALHNADDTPMPGSSAAPVNVGAAALAAPNNTPADADGDGEWEVQGTPSTPVIAQKHAQLATIASPEFDRAVAEALTEKPWRVVPLARDANVTVGTFDEKDSAYAGCIPGSLVCIQDANTSSLSVLFQPEGGEEKLASEWQALISRSRGTAPNGIVKPVPTIRDVEMAPIRGWVLFRVERWLLSDDWRRRYVVLHAGALYVFRTDDLLRKASLAQNVRAAALAQRLREQTVENKVPSLDSLNCCLALCESKSWTEEFENNGGIDSLIACLAELHPKCGNAVAHLTSTLEAYEESNQSSQTSSSRWHSTSKQTGASTVRRRRRSLLLEMTERDADGSQMDKAYDGMDLLRRRALVLQCLHRLSLQCARVWQQTLAARHACKHIAGSILQPSLLSEMVSFASDRGEDCLRGQRACLAALGGMCSLSPSARETVLLALVSEGRHASHAAFLPLVNAVGSAPDPDTACMGIMLINGLVDGAATLEEKDHVRSLFFRAGIAKAFRRLRMRCQQVINYHTGMRKRHFGQGLVGSGSPMSPAQNANTATPRTLRGAAREMLISFERTKQPFGMSVEALEFSCFDLPQKTSDHKEGNSGQTPQKRGGNNLGSGQFDFLYDSWVAGQASGVVAMLEQALIEFETSARADATEIKERSSDARLLASILSGRLKGTPDPGALTQLLENMLRIPDQTMRKQLREMLATVQELIPVQDIIGQLSPRGGEMSEMLLGHSAVGFSTPNSQGKVQLTPSSNRKAGPALPPPPPPPGGLNSQGPAPPPPPPLFGKKTEPSTRAPKSKMRILHWKKLGMGQVNGTMWSTASGTSGTGMVTGGIDGRIGKVKLDERVLSTLEEAFAALPPKPTKPVVRSSNEGLSDSQADNDAVELVDPKRAHLVSIKLSAFTKDMPLTELAEAVARVDDRVISGEMPRILLGCLPTEEEIAKLSQYKGPIDRLSDCERWFYLILGVRNPLNRLTFLDTLAAFENQFMDVESLLDKIDRATLQLQSSPALRTAMMAILEIGNFMNHGGFASGAHGFRMQALRNVVELKATVLLDEKGLPISQQEPVRLMNVLVQFLARHYPHALALPAELSAIKQTDRLDHAFVTTELKSLLQRVVNVANISAVADTELKAGAEDFLSRGLECVRRAFLHSVATYGRVFDALRYMAEVPPNAVRPDVGSLMGMEGGKPMGELTSAATSSIVETPTNSPPVTPDDAPKYSPDADRNAGGVEVQSKSVSEIVEECEECLAALQAGEEVVRCAQDSFACLSIFCEDFKSCAKLL